MKLATVRDATDALRDLRNWLAVFKTEYDLPDEAYKTLHKKVEDVGSKMDGIVCKDSGVVEKSVLPATKSLHEFKIWLAVFADEYDLAEEEVKVLGKQIENVAKKIAKIKCV